MKYIFFICILLFSFSCNSAKNIKIEDDSYVINMASIDYLIKVNATNTLLLDSSQESEKDSYYYFKEKRDNITFSIHLFVLDSSFSEISKLRDFKLTEFIAKKIILNPENIRISDKSFSLEKFVTSTNNYQLMEKHYFTYFILDNYGLEYNVILTLPSQIIDSVSMSVFQNMRLMKINRYKGIPTSVILTLGNISLADSDFKRAIHAYREIYERENIAPNLKKSEFITFVENMAFSYAKTRDWESAETCLDFGLKRYNDYPMFYYNKAKINAVINNDYNTIKFLKEAIKYKENRLTGYLFPNILEETEFIKLANNSTAFSNFINEYKISKKRN